MNTTDAAQEPVAPLARPAPSSEGGRRGLGLHRRRQPTGTDFVLETVRQHAAALLGTARKYSLCADDAHDAYQRTMEIFIRRANTVDPETALPWLRTVIRHEAYDIRRRRKGIVGSGEVDLDGREATHLPDPDERLESFDRLNRSAEALQRLKPQEMRALVLKAHGLSYKEICEATGWTYTKVNRCLTEGRRSFFDRYAAIESGAECDRWADALLAAADGSASADELADLRPHLRNCSACRSTLGELRRSRTRVTAVVPAVLVAVPAGGGDAGSALLARASEIAIGLHERLLVSAGKLQMSLEAASTAKLAAVAASATAIAGGGVAAVEGPLDRPSKPWHAEAAETAAQPPAAAPTTGSPAESATWSTRSLAFEQRVRRDRLQSGAKRKGIDARERGAARRRAAVEHAARATPAGASAEFDVEGSGGGPVHDPPVAGAKTAMPASGAAVPAPLPDPAPGTGSAPAPLPPPGGGSAGGAGGGEFGP